MPDTVFGYELGDLHIKAAVLGYLYESFLTPPLDGVNAISSLADSQGRNGLGSPTPRVLNFPTATATTDRAGARPYRNGLGDIVQSGLALCDLLDLHEQIQSSQLKREIQDGVSHHQENQRKTQDPKLKT